MGRGSRGWERWEEVRKNPPPAQVKKKKKDQKYVYIISHKAAFRYFKAAGTERDLVAVNKSDGGLSSPCSFPHASSSHTGVSADSRAGRTSAHDTPRRARRTVWRDL